MKNSVAASLSVYPGTDTCESADLVKVDAVLSSDGLGLLFSFACYDEETEGKGKNATIAYLKRPQV